MRSLFCRRVFSSSLLPGADSFSDDPAAARRAGWLKRALSFSTLALLAATWRLWTPQTVFPRVPLLGAAGSVPAAIQWLLVGMTVGSLATSGLARSARVGQWALRVFAAALGGLLLCDQHRLQPWAYQAVMVALALANLPACRALTVVRVLTIGIYFYSGLSKLDYEFLHTLGQQFLAGLLACVGAHVADLPAAGRLVGALLFPLAELAIAGGFCLRRTRLAALCASLVLHAALLLVLGPWGLHHSLGVLLWNGYFILQNVLLFGERAARGEMSGEAERPAAEHAATEATRRAQDSAVSPAPVGPAGWATYAMIAVALLLPLGEPLGWCDAWPGWSLYSPSSERVVIFVHRRAADRLGGLAAMLKTPEEDDPWMQLQIDYWSLASLGAPLYPQNRFQLGVAEALGGGCQLGHWIQAIEFGRASRWTGQRERRKLAGTGQIAAAASGFWLNAHPDRPFKALPGYPSEPQPSD
jgi:hypothetical protein